MLIHTTFSERSSRKPGALVLRVMAVCLISIGSAIGLVGCTPAAPTAARVVNGTLVFVACDGFSFDTVRFAAIDYSDWAAGEVELWAATGNGGIEPGGEIAYGAPPSGTDTEFGPKTLPESPHRIDVILESHYPDGTVEDVLTGLFDSRQLQADRWLRSDGSHNEVPCD